MVLVPGTLETGNLALQNFDFAGVRIDAADLHLRLGFQCFQELPEADEIRIGVRMTHAAIILFYRRAKRSFPLETPLSRRSAQRIAAALRAACQTGGQEINGEDLLGPNMAGGPCDSVLPPILFHDDATGGVEARPVVHQAAKDVVAIRYGRPTDAERITDAGLPLLRGLGQRSRTQESHGEGGCYGSNCSDRGEYIQAKLNRQPFVWHVHKPVPFCVCSLKRIIGILDVCPMTAAPQWTKMRQSSARAVVAARQSGAPG